MNSDLRIMLRELADDMAAPDLAPDLAPEAWRRAGRVRRWRSAATIVSAAAVVGAVLVGLAVLQSRPQQPGPAPSPSPTLPTGPVTTGPSTEHQARSRPDAHYAGVPVWWAPTLAEEATLPAYPDDPFPASIDLDDPGQVVGDLADQPLDRAIAAFADPASTSVTVLGPDGAIRTLDVSRVRPMTGPDGQRALRLGPSLLSRSGTQLLFPQAGSVLVYTLRTGEWRTIDTGTSDTWDATWISDHDFVLAEPTRPVSPAPEYSSSGREVGSTNVVASGLPDVPRGTSQLLGRSRTGGSTIGQALSAGAPIPPPPGVPVGASSWIATNGEHSALLLIGTEDGRSSGCCDVGGWISADTVLYESPTSTGLRLVAWQVDTGRFWTVTQVSGANVGSYAQLTEPTSVAP